MAGAGNICNPLLTRRRFVSRAAQAGVLVAAGGATGLLSGCGGSLDFLNRTRTITDDVGRTVEIPSTARLKKVYFTSPLAQIFCLTLAPDLVGGTCMSFSSEQLEYLPQGTEALDNMGSLSQGGSIDVDALGYHDVQIIFSISGTDLTDVNVEDAIALQDSTGIPVVLIDGSFGCISDSYRLLGECLGRRERAEELARYCEVIYSRVREAVELVPDDQLVSYYFAEGAEGLQTEPNVSQHSLAFQAVRGVNVAADIDPNELGRSAGTDNNHDMVNVSMDEVRSWNPDYIIAWDFKTRKGASQIISTSSEWGKLQAVRNDRLYTMPNLPFAFCDRPPGVNRFLGVQWLANLLYPDYYQVDMVDIIRDFYSTCYWRDISIEQAQSILAQ